MLYKFARKLAKQEMKCESVVFQLRLCLGQTDPQAVGNELLLMNGLTC